MGTTDNGLPSSHLELDSFCCCLLKCTLLWPQDHTAEEKSASVTSKDAPPTVSTEEDTTASSATESGSVEELPAESSQDAAVQEGTCTCCLVKLFNTQMTDQWAKNRGISIFLILWSMKYGPLNNVMFFLLLNLNISKPHCLVCHSEFGHLCKVSQESI